MGAVLKVKGMMEDWNDGEKKPAGPLTIMAGFGVQSSVFRKDFLRVPVEH